MIINYGNDGNVCDKDKLIRDGFNVNEERDFRKKYIRNINTAEKSQDYEFVFDFVGFITNNNEDIITIFPKNYRVENINLDSTQLFKLISKHRQRRPEIYLGSNYGKFFNTNYPFAAFFGVYNYFEKYGIYIEDKVFIKPSIGGKINWKETVRLSNKYISNGELIFSPIYYEKKYYFSNFLTECIIFVIDYTIDKFGIFVDLNKTGKNFPEFDFLSTKEITIERLLTIRQQIFKDSLIDLIDHLINFFGELKEGGSYYFKHYYFEYIWEDMVLNYLNNNYKEVKDGKIIFDSKIVNKTVFSKKRFYPNEVNTDNFIEPDYYNEDEDIQLIFDAKYYTKVYGMDYKQIAYYFLLNGLRENITDSPKFKETYSALILPGEERRSKVHFKMNPLFNKDNKNFIISEEYLDIREVINNYLK